MDNLFLISVRPRCLSFSCSYGFTLPNRNRKLKQVPFFISLPFKPRSSLCVSVSHPRDGQFDIISTSECSDGSVVFRFGDAREIEEERARIAAEEEAAAAAALVNEAVQVCEESEVIDEEIDIVGEELVESGLLREDSTDLVEESVSGSEVVEGESDGELELGETLLDDSGNVKEGFVDGGGVSGSEAVEDDIDGGLELSETLFDDNVDVEEGFVVEGSVSGSDAVEGESDGGLESSETLFDDNVDVEEGFVVEDSGVVVDEIDGGLELNETSFVDNADVGEGLLVEDSDVVEGEIDGGLEVEETLFDDNVSFDVKDSVDDCDAVESKIDVGNELSGTLLDEGEDLEESFVDKDDVGGGLELSEKVLDGSIGLEDVGEDGFSDSDAVEGEIDGGLELSEMLVDESVDSEENFVDEDNVSDSDALEIEIDGGLKLSETLLEEIVGIEEDSVKDGINDIDVVEGESEVSKTLVEVSINMEDGYVGNSVSGSDMVEGESDGGLELIERLLDDIAELEEAFLKENNEKSSSLIEVHELDNVVEVESGVLNGSSESNAETVPSSSDMENQVVKRDEFDATLENGVLNGSSESNAETIPSSSDMDNQVVKRDEFDATLASLEPPGTTNMHHSYTPTGRSEENANVEAPDHSGIAVNIIVDAEMNNVSDERTDSSCLIEVMPVSTTLEAERVLDEETSCEAVDEFVEADQIVSSEMLDVCTLSSNGVETNQTITEGVLQGNNGAGESVHSILEIRPTSLVREEVTKTELFLSSGASLLPYSSKALTGREDAYFVAPQDWLGVADGISQWSLEGISVGSYAQELMENCKKIVLDGKGVPITNPVEVLNRSVSETESSGSSTVLVAFFDGRVLRVANIGDSGFIIVRNGAVFLRSSPMLHGFNFPFRIERGDDPSKIAEEYEIDLAEDDIIVTASDGLFDNLYDEEIASLVSKSMQDCFTPQQIAELLATSAMEVASASTGSPFADAALAAGYGEYTGGKLDDVTVIVSAVQKKSNSRPK